MCEEASFRLNGRVKWVLLGGCTSVYDRDRQTDSGRMKEKHHKTFKRQNSMTLPPPHHPHYYPYSISKHRDTHPYPWSLSASEVILAEIYFGGLLFFAHFFSLFHILYQHYKEYITIITINIY